MMTMPMAPKPMNWVACLDCFSDGGSGAADEWHGGGVEDAGDEVAGH